MGKVLPAIAAAMALSPAAFALDYSDHSPLATGTWAKLGVSENGVYEISYDRLRELGFSNPENVAVWGEGAPTYPFDFLSSDNVRQIPETLQKIAVWHHNDKIYFYATGPENLSFVSDTSVNNKARFANDGLNIYTNYGYYFLSDTTTPTALRESDKDPEDGGYIDQGYAYSYHEIDNTQGSSNSGKDFWGENFLGLTSNRIFKFPYAAPGLVDGSVGNMTVRLISQAVAFDTTCALDDDDSFKITSPNCSTTTYFSENSKKNYNVTPRNKTGNFTMVVPDGDDYMQVYLDYFLLTYKRNIEFDENESQFNVTARVSTIGMVKFPEGDNVEGWDVTSSNSPIHLNAEANGLCTLDRGDRNLVFFDTDATQKKPAFLDAIACQDIHGDANTTNPDMIIITTDEVKDCAQELADFHSQYEGATVLVYTANQVYNEFSQGHPDPMAYRNMCKMFYEKSGSKLKNVLLYGRCLSNPRFVEDGLASNSMIILQGEPNLRSTELYSFSDAYGILTDKVSSSSYPSQKMLIGVGIIPALSAAEAQNYNDKVKRYYFDDSKPYWLDKVYYMADDYDSQLHLTQSESLANYLKSHTSNAMYPSKTYFGEYGRNLVMDKVLEEYKKGSVFNTYIGHGSIWAISKHVLIHTYDIPKFDNDRLGFMNFAGCVSTVFECGMRGLPELLTFDTTKGLIGGQVSLRSSWSNENKQYMTAWQYVMVNGYDEKGRALTLGEGTRMAKNNHTSNTGKYKFALMADPMLRLPIPTMKVAVSDMPEEIAVGETVNISGTITNPVASISTNDFNGTLLVKWFAAGRTEKIANKLTGYVPSDIDTVSLREITYEEDILATEAYKVKNGKFNISLTCPSVMATEADKSVKVAFVAYDEENHDAAASTYFATIAANAEALPEDTQAPVIESMEVGLQANGCALSDCTLTATVTDDTGLSIDAYSPSAPLSLILDDETTIDNLPEYIRLEDGSKQLNVAVPLEGLSYGYHKLTLSVMDYAGNRASRDYTFKVDNDNTLSPLQLAEAVCRSQATLTLPEDAANATGSAKIVISDAYGNIVRTDVMQDAYKWDLLNSNGERVAPGLYKAYTIFTAENGKGTATKIVNIPVLKSL
jgi:hypothetical protein